jgi:hypothetical protein
MTTREDFKQVFEIEDFARKETHTLESIEATGCEEQIGKNVLVTGFVFYPNALKSSRFSVVVDQEKEGSLSLDALELLVDKEDFEDFLGLLHDACSDFNVDDKKPNFGGEVKYVYETVEWFNDEPEYIR